MPEQVREFLSQSDINKWYSVKDLQSILGMPRSTVQEHLTKLRRDRIVQRHWDGQRWRFRRRVNEGTGGVRRDFHEFNGC